jgi:hypothetical protein
MYRASGSCKRASRRGRDAPLLHGAVRFPCAKRRA